MKQAWADQETAAAAFFSGFLFSHVYAETKVESSEALFSEEAMVTADAIMIAVADATGYG